ncbi:Concanavalin A-like lectin/glucanase, subgroup [Cynara cardunculus var. scolymus]|uniref:non-specific serine/threonine protein kinase n=1 Tax=Cynara cardunculus var. scolymus TaxID=59895 RepID=A0A103YJZ5_CYNCS|nr:Concanavalin A-like lectin/glucanase, subgroup [Cynara cardunculus var. scolymus]
MLFGILCLLLLPFSFASINTTCLPSDEVEALRDIGRKLRTDWDFNEDPCGGTGNWGVVTNNTFENNVSCSSNVTNCNIVTISLKGQNLQGTLPPELVKLRYLQILYTPFFLLLLVNLTSNICIQLLICVFHSYRDLTRNLLSGNIPPEWGSMEQIVNINVEDNLMSGRIPEELGDLSSIESLLLNGNYFTGELPPSLANLITLKQFRISSNNFSGKIPDFIGGWPRLETLIKKCRRISDLGGPETLFPSFTNTSFKNLILRNCNLIGELPKSLASHRSTLKVLYLTGNMLSGRVPDWTTSADSMSILHIVLLMLFQHHPSMLSLAVFCDLSYNNFTFESSQGLRCMDGRRNLFAAFSMDNTSFPISIFGSAFYSLYINCGGSALEDENKDYEADVETGGASYFSMVDRRWRFSNTGHFLDNNGEDNYLPPSTSRVVNNSELYQSARASALSLTYYSLCMAEGSYNVSLHFAEIFFTDDGTYSSLGRRVFDIYIQGVLVEKDFDISEKAGGVGKAYVSTHSVNVTSTLEIRLYWAGKGTINIPSRGVYGPIISAISVNSTSTVEPQEDGPGDGVSGGVVAGIVVGAVCIIILILGVLWWWGYLRRRDTMDLELAGVTGSFTLRQIKDATNNFDDANKIGEGGFGSVYKGVLPDGTLIAVKQLSSKSRQGNREFLNELGMISALQHPHLVKLHGCCIEGNQLLLAYEYMENNSLARALFGPKQWQLELDWPTRYRICIGIARGMSFLHEESRLKIVHRDIKATNVLLDKDLNAKISDFGLAKLDEEDDTHISTRVAGTYGYMAPEYALRGYLTDKADVYSYGIVLLEIVSGMANVVNRAKENRFVLLDRAIDLKDEGNLMELVDPRLGSDYDVKEMMIVINLALLCTTISPTDRPAMSAVVSMLEGRIVPREFAVGQSISMSEMDREKMMKQLVGMNESGMEEMSIPYTDSLASTADLYPANGFMDALRVIGRKLGKNWDFDEDPCTGRGNWVSAAVGRDDANNVTCSIANTTCNIVSISVEDNQLSGGIPEELGSLSRIERFDLSYNKFTLDSSQNLRCQMRRTNLFASFSADNVSSGERVSCLRDYVCGPNSTSWYVNCGGVEQLEDGNVYEADVEPGGATFFSTADRPWRFSNTGHFLDNGGEDTYVLTNTSRVVNNSKLYESARTSALSLTYYGSCMHNGSYTVSLHFAEIRFTDNGTFSSLGRRVFDIYIQVPSHRYILYRDVGFSSIVFGSLIANHKWLVLCQGVLVEKDFDISEKAGGVGIAIVRNYTVYVTSSLEIRLYWAGKGTLTVPNRGVYGPLISAISVNPNFPVPREAGSGNGSGNGVSGGIVAGIVVGAVCSIILILGLLWWWGYLRHKDTMDLELTGVTGSFTLRQIKAATNNFDVANKIGEGGFGSVYKGVLPDGTLIAVKQLSSKSRQGNREFLNELGMISALQHPHLVKLHGCCIEGNQLLLAYEYMENNSLARALFGPKEMQLELDWPTRYRICIGIARGMSFLHEESRLKIVHRDIKATNVLLDDDLNAKISDFGLAKLDEEDDTHISTRVAGTYGYMAPEYALRGYLTDKADVYSYGIVLLEVVSGMANVVDKAKENRFVLLDRAIDLKNAGNLMELVDPRLGSDYDVQEMMVVINLALLCTTISPTDRPAMSAVVSMLEGRIVPQEFAVEQSFSMSEMDREKMKQLVGMNESGMEEMSIPYTDSTASTADLYPVNVDALRVIGRKLGKNWDLNEDPCTGRGNWVFAAVGRDDANNVTCSIANTTCNIVSM